MMFIKMMTGTSDKGAMITKKHSSPTLFNGEFFEISSILLLLVLVIALHESMECRTSDLKEHKLHNAACYLSFSIKRLHIPVSLIPLWCAFFHFILHCLLRTQHLSCSLSAKWSCFSYLNSSCSYFICCKIFKLSRYLSNVYMIGRVVYWQRKWKLHVYMKCMSVISASAFNMVHSPVWARHIKLLEARLIFFWCRKSCLSPNKKICKVIIRRNPGELSW